MIRKEIDTDEIASALLLCLQEAEKNDKHEYQNKKKL